MLQYFNRQTGDDLDSILHQAPPDCEIIRLNRNPIMRTVWASTDVKFYGGIEDWKKPVLVTA
jgi:hypothetical protein